MISAKKLQERARINLQEHFKQSPLVAVNKNAPNKGFTGSTGYTRIPKKPITGADLLKKSQPNYYNSLHDPNLAGYWRKPYVKQHLIRTGLMSQSGTCVPTSMEKAELNRVTRNDNRSSQHRETLQKRMGQRLERMKADIDNTKRRFTREGDAKPSCPHCGCTKLAEVRSAITVDSYYVMDKCLQCGRKTGRRMVAQHARENLQPSHMPVSTLKLPTMKQRHLPRSYSSPMKVKQLPCMKTKFSEPSGDLTDNQSTAVAAGSLRCNKPTNTAPSLSEMMDEKLEELLQAEEDSLKEMYDKVVKRKEELKLKKKIFKKPLQDQRKEQDELIARKEAELRSTCKRYITLATAMDAIKKESSSGKAVVPENDVPTMESLPVTLEKKDLDEIQDIERMVRHEIQVTKLLLAKKATEEEEEQKKTTTVALIPAPPAGPRPTITTTRRASKFNRPSPAVATNINGASQNALFPSPPADPRPPVRSIRRASRPKLVTVQFSDGTQPAASTDSKVLASETRPAAPPTKLHNAPSTVSSLKQPRIKPRPNLLSYQRGAMPDRPACIANKLQNLLKPSATTAFEGLPADAEEEEKDDGEGEAHVDEGEKANGDMSAVVSATSQTKLFADNPIQEMELESADTSDPLVTNVTSDVVLRTNDGDIAAQQTRASPPVPTASETVENDEDYQSLVAAAKLCVATAVSNAVKKVANDTIKYSSDTAMADNNTATVVQEKTKEKEKTEENVKEEEKNKEDEENVIQDEEEEEKEKKEQNEKKKKQEEVKGKELREEEEEKEGMDEVEEDDDDKNIVNTAKQCVANALANAIKRLSTSFPPLSYTDEDEECHNNLLTVNSGATLSSMDGQPSVLIPVADVPDDNPPEMVARSYSQELDIVVQRLVSSTLEAVVDENSSEHT